MDSAAKYLLQVTAGEMSYNHKSDNKVYYKETFTNRKLRIFLSK